MGIVALNRVEVLGKIGVKPEERKIGRTFIVDIEAKTLLKKVSETDDLQDGLNYELFANAIHNQFQKEFKMMEAAARAIAIEILEEAPDVVEMKIRIQKIAPFMKGNIFSASIIWQFPEDF